MSVFEAIVQGIIQGITEFLPVSSSGHIALFQHFSPNMEGSSATFVMALLHLGTLVAVFIAFHETIWKLIKEAFRMLGDLFTLKFSLKNMNDERKMIIMFIVASIPLAIIYPFKSIYDSIVQAGSLIFLGICFLFTSAILFISDRKDNGTKDVKEMTYGNALFIGLFQGFALLPGVSRSGSTIGSALISGFSKEFAVQFSFILGIPAIFAGSLVEIKDALEVGATVEVVPMFIGFVVAAVVGFLSIKMIDYLVKTDKYKIFAIYTLIVGIVTVGIGIFS
nr:undecaprenyl-diphosphate phosphatase [uncultured Cellulosilyticum sp.]